MLFLNIRVYVEEKLVRNFKQLIFWNIFVFIGTRLYHISFVLRKDHRSLQKKFSFNLEFHNCFLYFIYIVYLRFEWKIAFKTREGLIV